MIPLGFEPRTSRVLGERDNHYTMESADSCWSRSVLHWEMGGTSADSRVEKYMLEPWHPPPNANQSIGGYVDAAVVPRLRTGPHGIKITCFRSVVVITLASHARGPGFEPQRKHVLFICVNLIKNTRSWNLVKFIDSTGFRTQDLSRVRRAW